MSVNSPTLVVVDDQADVLHAMRDLFRRHYRVLTFESGREAIATLESDDAAVVLTDQRMPEMSGVEFLRNVKRLRPDTTRLLFTGYADVKAVIDAINEGNVFRYVSKEVDPEELAVIVRQAVEHHELLVERRRLIGELRESNARLVEANRLKSAFIEVASHELNTPVAVVLGMAELWKLQLGEHRSAAEHAWIERIQVAGKRLAGTIQRMLKLMRADQFDEPLQLRPCELEPLLHTVVADLQPFLDARDQHAEIRALPALGSATVDPEKLSDVLTNLIINAIKFSPDGGVIQLGAGPEGSDRVWFRVSDSGVGIAPADRAHLFEPFFTGYDTLHHSSGEYQFGKRGIGLGLCLVKTFVEMHGGKVEVTSVPDQGSTFRFTLPRVPGRRRKAKAS